MAFTVIHKFRGATREQYLAAQDALHPPDGSLPPGQLVHIGGTTDDDLIVIAVFDSEESWILFRDGILLPRLARLATGPAGLPEEITFEPIKFQVA